MDVTWVFLLRKNKKKSAHYNRICKKRADDCNLNSSNIAALVPAED